MNAKQQFLLWMENNKEILDTTSDSCYFEIPAELLDRLYYELLREHDE